MVLTQLIQVAVFLAAAAIAAPLGRFLRLGSVLGYLAAGIVIGPFGIGLIYSLYDVENILHFAEFGVVMLLFVIGLELRPIRLWAMRSAIFGLGSVQLVATAVVLAAIGLGLGLTTVKRCSSGFLYRSRRPLSRCNCWKRRARSISAMAGSPFRCCCSRTWPRSR